MTYHIFVKAIPSRSPVTHGQDHLEGHLTAIYQTILAVAKVNLTVPHTPFRIPRQIGREIAPNAPITGVAVPNHFPNSGEPSRAVYHGSATRSAFNATHHRSKG